MNKSLEKRLYIFVPYNISDIQKGIQAGHVAEQYAYKYGKDKDYIDYIENWKTWIILNGGTTNSSRDENHYPLGTLNQIADDLADNNIKFQTFFEPDLNSALSAVCFLVDERIFNYKDYPDWDGTLKWDGLNVVKPQLGEWIKKIGGDKNVFLRQLLKYKKLA